MLEKYHLLVINDNPVSLEMMRSIVSHHRELDSVFATTVPAGIDHIHNDLPFHLIITDLSAPHHNALDVIKAAKAKSPDSRVLLVTTFGKHQEIINAIKTGVYDYLHKPFRPEELNLKINNTIRFFKCMLESYDAHQVTDELKQTIAEKDEKIAELEKEIARIQKIIQQYEPEEQPMDLATAIARAAEKHGNKLNTYSLFRHLTDLEQLYETKKISQDEFQNLRKAMLEKAYQVT